MFCEEIEDLYDDGFEGSTDELRIFKEVFYGGDGGSIKKRCFGAVANDSNNSGMACASSTKESYAEDSCIIGNGHVNVKEDQERISRGIVDIGLAREGSCWGQRNVPEGSCRAMECSVDKQSAHGDKTYSLLDEQNNLFQLETTEKIVPDMPAPDSCNNSQNLRCSLVESSKQGIISSFYLLERYRVGGRVHTNIAKSSKAIHSDLLDMNEKEVLGCKPITSPVSHQGTESNLLVEGSCSTHNSGFKGDNGGSENSVLPNTDVVDGNCQRYCKKDPRPRLRQNVNQLFMAMGWSREKRERNSRNYQENVYISPKGKAFYELHKAWRSIGEFLFSGGSKSKLKLMQEENAKHWASITDLWSDLSKTLTYIENEMENLNASVDLARKWTLLDPFVTKVLIDRQLGELREGRPARSVGTALFDKRKRRDILAAKRFNLSKINTRHGGSGAFFEKQPASYELVKAFVPVDTHHHGPHGIGKSAESPSHRNQPFLNDHYRNGGSVDQDKHGILMKALKGLPVSVKGKRSVLGETTIIDGAGDPCVGIFRNQTESSDCDSLQAYQPGISLLPDETSLHDDPIARESADINGASTEGEGKQIAESFQNEMCDQSAVGQRNLVSLHYSSDSVVEQEEKGLPEECMLNNVIGTGFRHDTHSQRSSSREDIHPNENGKRVDYSPCEVSDSLKRETGLELLQQAYLEDDTGLDTTVSKIEMEQINATITTFKAKKSSKKIKKISEIKSTKFYQESGSLNLSVPESEKSENCQNEKIGHRSVEGQKCCEADDINDDTCDNTLPLSTLRHQIMKQTKSKKLRHQSSEPEEFAAVGFNGNIPMKSSCLNDDPEVPLQKNKGSLKLNCKKIAKCNKSLHNKNGQKTVPVPSCQIEDDDFLIAALILNKDFKSNNKNSTRKAYKKKGARRKHKCQKRSCRLLPRNPGSNGNHNMDGKSYFSGARTVLSWLVDMGVVSVNDVLQYRSSKDGTIVKDGWVTKDGVLCICCNKILSISEFKVHAGFKLYRPCSNLFTESGKPFTLCQLQAWSAEYKARNSGRQAVEISQEDQNDDICGLCGDVGELLCCDNCPSTFHQVCLSIKELPEGSWYCSSCTCQICGDVVRKKEESSSPIFLECSQCDHKYHSTCIIEGGICKVDSDPWFCGERCQEIYSGLRSRVGISNLITDGFSWTLLRCNHGGSKVHSAQRFALTAECNSKLAVGLTIMEECFLPMVDPRTGINMIPQAVYNWGSEFTRLNFQGFYTAVLEKRDELISVATFRVHGVKVAEMPLVATRGENRRQGMCRRLITAIEEMLTSLKVEKLVVTAIPSLMDTWTSGFGFKPMEDEEKESLRKLNFMSFPGTVMLGKSLYVREAMEIEGAGPSDELLSNPVGNIENGICVDVGINCVGHSVKDDHIVEVSSEPEPMLECDLHLVDDHASLAKNNLEKLSSGDSLSTLGGR